MEEGWSFRIVSSLHSEVVSLKGRAGVYEMHYYPAQSCCNCAFTLTLLEEMSSGILKVSVDFYPDAKAIYSLPPASENRAFARLESCNENGTRAGLSALVSGSMFSLAFFGTGSVMVSFFSGSVLLFFLIT